MTALEAYNQSIINNERRNNPLFELQSRILKAVIKGDFDIYVYGYIAPDILSWLADNGYKSEQFANGSRIYWHKTPHS